MAWLPQQYTERVEAPGGAREHTCGLGHRHQADTYPQRLERPEKQLGSAYGTHRCEPGDGAQTIRAQLGIEAVTHVLDRASDAEVTMGTEPSRDARSPRHQPDLPAPEDGRNQG